MSERGLVNGVRVMVDPRVPCEKWERRPRLPKTKNRRIRRKWQKRYPQGAWVPDDKVYMVMGMMVMHPRTFERLNKELKR